MLPEIQKAYLDGRLMLLLGAGASAGSVDSTGAELPMGDELAKELSSGMGWSYSDELLSTVYSAINGNNSAYLHSYLRDRLTNTRPSAALRTLASYPWPRIFTLNIDDCFENASRNISKQRLRIYSRDSPLEEIDPIFNTVQLVKLNGSADKPEDGFIFSPQEYGEGSNRMPVWYRELAQNYSSYTFVFVGSRLNEPLLQHALAEMRSAIRRSPLRGYVITPSATDIEKHHLESLNLQHIPGGIQDFATWMKREIADIPTGWSLAVSRRPELRNIDRILSDRQKRALNSITLVSSDSLPRTSLNTEIGRIRNFYRGFKPEWADILDDIPANIAFIGNFIESIEQHAEKRKCIALVGQAGSGKSTAMMKAALHLSLNSNCPVYFLREPVSEINNVILSLEEINTDRFYIFIDKIDSMRKELREFIESSDAKNACVIFSERVNIWTRRVRDTLGPYTSYIFNVKKIVKEDASLILEKIEEFGPWTRLQGMNSAERLKEIYDRADRQLLIGLMEATTGVGFTQIIRSDFAGIGDDSHKQFLVLVGLASIHRYTISPNIVGRALVNLSIDEGVNVLASEVEGIVLSQGGKFAVRHPIYARELFEKIASPDMIKDCLISLLTAYADYEAPVIRHIGKSDGVLFKSVINHRFVREMMRNDESRVRAIYGAFETTFHVDGLYWLQYGLALRGFGRHSEALEKLITAKQAFSSPQIEHAYAQQLLIIAKNIANWDEAEPLLVQAIDAFRSLDSVGWEGDAYPIVSLAEGHISVVLRFQGLEAAQSLARQYGNELLSARKTNPNKRLQEAATTVVMFATTGTWKESYQPDYLEAE